MKSTHIKNEKKLRTIYALTVPKQKGYVILNWKLWNTWNTQFQNEKCQWYPSIR